MRTSKLSPLLRALKQEGLVEKVSRKTWVVKAWPAEELEKFMIQKQIGHIRKLVAERTL